MALDFLTGALPAIGKTLNQFNFRRPKPNYGATPSEARANALFQALLDPNNSLVKQNTDINMQRGMQDLLMQLRLMQIQGTRQQARGVRNTFFDPERADDVVNYLLTRGQPAISEAARNKATGDIRSTAESLLKFQPYEQERINARDENRGKDYQQFQLGGGYEKLGQGLQDLLGSIFGGGLPWQRPGNVNPAGGFY